MVAEGGNRRHQLDAQAGAIVIKVSDLSGLQGACAPPSLAHARESHGVLDVELQLIELIQGQYVRPVPQPVHGGHPTTGHIQTIDACWVGGAVLDVQGREHRTALHDDLAKGLHPPSQSLTVAAADIHDRVAISLIGDTQKILLGIKFLVQI